MILYVDTMIAYVWLDSYLWYYGVDLWFQSVDIWYHILMILFMKSDICQSDITFDIMQYHNTMWCDIDIICWLVTSWYDIIIIMPVKARLWQYQLKCLQQSRECIFLHVLHINFTLTYFAFFFNMFACFSQDG